MIRMNVERVRLWVGFAIISFVWGSTWLAIKIGLGSAPPFFAAGIRFAIASSILFIIVRTRRLHVPVTPDAKKLYFVLGFLSFGIPYALVYWGEQFIPSGLCSVLFAAYPFWVAIFSHLLLRNERLDPFKVSGIILGFAGLVVIFSGDLEWSGTSALLGMAAIMTSTIIQGFALIMIKKYGQPVNPFAMNLVGMTIGAIVLLALGVAFERGRQFVFNSAAIGSILYLAAVGSVIAFVTYHWLLKRIEAVYLSLTSFINPIIAVILGAIVLGETLSPMVFAGSGLVLAGLLAANGRQLYGKIHARL
jgi:drug/metabolite transporter (DMT)-like permease